ncbi:hypothetical protein KSC_039810 [Ktedonobacter sp. SOSP1-52]|uniref:helix-turn-helix domain-containing protein n=1 Tax=Ktedonobacter sp. SOSP1-52 TaxID=2778366 RepID=UPI001916B641|nr:helix-turn-helix transcriptional regulator [Ktedonobacter sp. SOSP1-52]GHO65089.1 hypothetical protein KSC_039810 [Ktedonobacter sp. SOSP1-52]
MEELSGNKKSNVLQPAGTFPNHLDHFIRHLGLQKAQLAKELGVSPGTLSHYITGRRAVPDDRRILFSKLLKRSIDDLFPFPETISELSSSQKFNATNRQQEPVNISGAHDQGGTLSLSALEQLSAHNVNLLHEWLVNSLEDGTRLRWQLYYTGRNTLTSDGLLNQILKLEVLAQHPRERAIIQRMLAQNYQLAGSLARDRFQYRTANDYFQKALHAIDKEDFPDMAATAIARQGLVYLRQGHIDKALPRYREAAVIAHHAAPYIHAYVLSGLAETYARKGERDLCYQTLDEAEHDLRRGYYVPEEDFAYVQPSLQSLEDARGECFILLGEIQQGLHYLQSAQQQLDEKNSRNHCRLVMQHAEAFLASGHPDQCVRYALEGLQIACTIESASNINWAREIYEKLVTSKWHKERVVKQLAEALLQ